MHAYLLTNQQTVFDWLAHIENGISTVTSITENHNEGKNTDRKVNAEIGVSNPFALLGVTFKGASSVSDTSQRSSGSSTQRRFRVRGGSHT